MKGSLTLPNAGNYTQGQIACDFLPSQNAARAERCTPKTTAAALDGQLKLWAAFYSLS